MEAELLIVKEYAHFHYCTVFKAGSFISGVMSPETLYLEFYCTLFIEKVC